MSFNFLTTQKQRIPINKKNSVRIKKISTSANINPAPWFVLSINAFKEAQAKSRAIIKKRTAILFMIVVIVFFISKYKCVKRETIEARKSEKLKVWPCLKY